MRITRISVANFGALHQFEKSFDEPFTCILQENGSGKTTLAAFLCAMLYGMDTTRKTDKTLKDREKYAPWQGGRYGGAIEFAANGRTYRIERTFGSSSATLDTTTVYEIGAGMRPVRFEESPGEHFLGIGKETFLKTAYLSDKDEGDLSGILPKLVGAPGAGERSEYEKAIALLESTKKEYRVQRGKGKKIDEAERKFRTCEEALQECKRAEAQLEEAQRQLEECKEDRKKISLSLSQKQKRESALLIREQTDRYEKAVTDAETALADFIAKNGETRPTKEQFDEMESLLSEVDGCKSFLAIDPLSPEERSEYERLRALYGNEAPQEAAFQSAADALAGLAALPEPAERRPEDEAFSQLDERFHGCEPDEAELRRIEALSEVCASTAEKRSQEMRRQIEEPPSSLPKPSAPTCLLLVLAIAALICGVVLSTRGKPAGIFFTAFSVIPFAGAALLYLKKDGKAVRKAARDSLEEETREEKELRAKLELYGYSGDLIKGADELIRASRTYSSKKAAYAEAERKKSEANKKREESLGILTAFFSRVLPDLAPETAHSSPETIRAWLITARDDRNEYESLSRILARNANERETRNANLQSARAALQEKLRPFGRDCFAGKEREAVQEEKALVSQYDTLIESLAQRRKEANEYKESHPLCAGSEEEIISAETAAVDEGDTLDDLNGRIAELESSIRTLRDLAQKTDERAAERAAAEEELTEARHRYEILQQTIGLLESAHNRLAARYTEPLRSAYAKYAEKVSGEILKGMRIDAEDLSLHFEREGELKKQANFSTGLVRLSEICMRLALIETAYDRELPFLLLDDPFAFLDDENCAKSMRLLQTLSERTQVIYLTCHSSRAKCVNCP